MKWKTMILIVKMRKTRPLLHNKWSKYRLCHHLELLMSLPNLRN